jgi:hypothetical protein
MGRSIFDNILSDIGFEPKPDEKHTISILRDKIIWHAVLYGSKEVENFALGKFESLVKGKNIHPDLQKSILQVGALNAQEESCRWFYQRLQSSQNEHERMNLLVALGCFRERAFMEKAQHYVLDKVPNRNKFIPIIAMGSNPYAIPYMWDWYVSHLDKLEQFHPVHYERVIAGIVPLGGIGKEEKVRVFFDDYSKKKDLAKDAIKMSLEKLEVYSRMRRS